MTPLYPAPNTPTPRLGRVRSVDLRDHRFALSDVMVAEPTRRSRTWYVRRVLDQRDTSACVGFSGTAWMDCGPVRNLVPDADAFQFAFDLYRAAQDVDEWPGGEPDYYGTSVRGLFKTLQARGVVSEYRWAFTAKEVAAWVLDKSPVVLGTVWASEMFVPDKSGFLKAEGEIVGGHAYCCIGANLDKCCPDGTKGAVRCVNSWGESFGDKGRFWLSLADLEKLMKSDGEAATATELKAPQK
jgi:hypothetical protein